MFDCHFDLLIYIYMSRNNIEDIKKYCKKIFRKDNITGGVFNFCYLPPEDMEKKMHMNKAKINIIENLKLVNKLIIENQIIPRHVKYIRGIEGLDYLEDINDIDELYNLGMRSTNIVWNNPNRFGGGSKASEEQGLTELGKQLVHKLVKSNIAIDLSHANEKTFYGIIEECRKLRNLGLEPIIYASHSNSKVICNVHRNLTDKQINIIVKEFNGTVGIVEYTPFVKESGIKYKIDRHYYEKYYFKHINHLKELLGNVENITVATDDMTFESDQKNKPPVYEHKEVGIKIRELLRKNRYSEEEIDKILCKNFESKILSRL